MGLRISVWHLAEGWGIDEDLFENWIGFLAAKPTAERSADISRLKLENMGESGCFVFSTSL